MRCRLAAVGLLAVLIGCTPGSGGRHAPPPARTVVYLIVDGLRWDQLWSSLVEPPPGDPLAEIFGARLSRSAWYVDGGSTFPSSTFTANATLVTGVPPSRHAVAGNLFFDRAEGKHRELDSPGAALQVFRRGLADGLLGAPTIYQRPGRKSLVSFHMYARGSDWLTPRLTDAAAYETEPERYDQLATLRLLDRLQRLAEESAPFPGLVTLYWPGLDGVTHAKGTEAQAEYLRTVVSRNLRILLDGPAGKGGGLRALPGGLDRFAFVLVSDHGQTDVMRWIALGELSRALEKAMLRRPEFRALGAAALRAHYALAPSGGEAQLYLRRPGAGWPSRLSGDRAGRELLEGVARALASDPSLGSALDLVLVASGEGGSYRGCRGRDRCLDLPEFFQRARVRAGGGNDPYPGGEDSVAALAGAPTAGDLLLTSRYQEGVAFLGPDGPPTSPYRAVHGSLWGSDMRVPLLVAGRGIEPGPREGGRGLLEAARVVVELAGSPLAEPGHPGRSMGRPRVCSGPPELLSPPRTWAIAGRPYRQLLAARDPEGGRMTWEAVRLPARMALDPSTGAIAWDPGEAELGDYALEVKIVGADGNSLVERYVLGVFLPPPEKVQAAATSGRVVVTWDPVPGARSYVVRRVMAGDRDVRGFETRGCRFVDPDPPVGARVGYLVHGVDRRGRGGAQAVAVTETPAPESGERPPPMAGER